MGGFGAYDIALKNPGRFCAVGGHSPALWFDGAETAPGAFDDAADFERNDVVGAVQADPDAFGDTRVWNDYGRPKTLPRLQRRLRRGAGSRRRRLHRPLMARRPRRRLLGRPLARLPALLRQRPRPLRLAPLDFVALRATRPRRAQRPGEPAGGVPGGGAGPQLSRPSAAGDRDLGPAIAGVSRVTSAIALTRESTSRTSLLLALVAPVVQVGGEAGRVDPGLVGEEQRPRHVEALGDDDGVAHAEDRRAPAPSSPRCRSRRGPRRRRAAAPRRRPAPCASCPARRRPRCGGRRRRGSSPPCPRARAPQPAAPGRPASRSSSRSAAPAPPARSPLPPAAPRRPRRSTPPSRSSRT